MPHDGDDASFDHFVTSTSGRMLAAARLLSASPEHAEDMVQEAYARTFARWSQVSGGEPYAYARRIMLNRYLDWWRRPWREYATDTLSDRPTPSDAVDRLAVTDQLRRGLAGLTRRERTVIVMRYFEDASEATIAETLDIAPGTVKSTANRALRKLRASGHFDLIEGERHG